MYEFVALMALIMSTVAMAIDGILPALGLIAAEMPSANPNDIQYVVIYLFAGLVIGQLFSGLISDIYGRRRILFLGMGIFIIGSVIAFFSGTLSTLLLGRFIQGFGAGAPRIITIAIVRDKFTGNTMAKTMSMILGIFIFVPAIAPSIGQLILNNFGWRAIFIGYIIVVTISSLWAFLRLEETLPQEKRTDLNISSITKGIKEVLTTPHTIGYTITSGLAFSILFTYISTSQQIFQDQFHVGEDFAIYFGILALSIGAAFFTNSMIVQKLGTHAVTTLAMSIFTSAALLFCAHTYIMGDATLLSFMTFFSVGLFCLGLSFGNFNAMAMQPMGHIAGLASAFIGFASTGVSVLVGGALAQSYTGTMHNISLGCTLIGLCATALLLWTIRYEKKYATNQGAE